MSDNGDIDNYIVEKALKRFEHNRDENRILRKRSEDYDIREEVFDKPTLMTLNELMTSKLFKYLNGVVKAGKEARIYWGVRADGTDVAVKIYLTDNVEFRKRLPYIIGDPRFKRIRKGIRNLVQLWAKKEYSNLKKAICNNIPCPKPFAVKNNVLVMEFIGKEGISAPILGDVDVTEKDYLELLSIIHDLYRNAHLVHSDLSEYNVFKHMDNLIIFDFGSAVDIMHPNAEDFLIRDITNINHFFSKRQIDTFSIEESLKMVKR
ncbi:MAG TPA: serine protein kinase RIO [Nitrososphaerales archaeon]